jgi:septation ring formation regulator EzrA
MDRLNKDIETMSAQCEKEKEKVDIQLERIAKEEDATAADRDELQKFKTKIENFTVKVEKARFNSSTEDLTIPKPEIGRAVTSVDKKTQGGAVKKRNRKKNGVPAIMPPK